MGWATRTIEVLQVGEVDRGEVIAQEAWSTFHTDYVAEAVRSIGDRGRGSLPRSRSNLPHKEMWGTLGPSPQVGSGQFLLTQPTSNLRPFESITEPQI
jgi:hypothetical protein